MKEPGDPSAAGKHRRPKAKTQASELQRCFCLVIVFWVPTGSSLCSLVSSLEKGMSPLNAGTNENRTRNVRNKYGSFCFIGLAEDLSDGSSAAFGAFAVSQG